MIKFTLALCAATTTLLLTACSTNTLYTHRKDFSPTVRPGAWQTEYERLDHGTRRADADALKGSNSHRALWRSGKWQEYFWH